MRDDKYDNINEPEETEDGHNYDFRELGDGERQRDELRSRKKDDKEEKDDVPNDDYEDVCFICRRPESKAGKMFRLPNHICVCNDCMHKTMDTVSQFDYQGLLNRPNMSDINTGKAFPNISFVNLADLQGDGGIPNKQKLKTFCRRIRLKRNWTSMWWGRNMPRK